MKLNTLQKLYTEQLKDIYSAEKQLIKALPKMEEFACSDDLKDGLKKHLIETEEHVERLEKIFFEMNISGNGKTCAAMKGLIEEGRELMEEDGDPAVLDAGLIATAQRVEHYEMAAYGCVKAYAEILGEKNAVALLQKTLDEETKADKKLSDLSKVVNADALKAGSAGDSEVDKASVSVSKGSKRNSGSAGSKSRNYFGQ
jgi:ferritin-like metal-binding protein YciE